MAHSKEVYTLDDLPSLSENPSVTAVFLFRNAFPGTPGAEIPRITTMNKSKVFVFQKYTYH